MIEIVTETSDEHGKHFNVRHVLGDVNCFTQGVEEVTHTERVHPVVVWWVSVSEVNSSKWLKINHANIVSHLVLKLRLQDTK